MNSRSFVLGCYHIPTAYVMVYLGLMAGEAAAPGALGLADRCVATRPHPVSRSHLQSLRSIANHAAYHYYYAIFILLTDHIYSLLVTIMCSYMQQTAS